MPVFINVGKRLVLRYERGTFTFSRLKPNASDQGIYDLATHFIALQDEAPRQIVQVTTRLIA
jgi:hypothetical protein